MDVLCCKFAVFFGRDAVRRAMENQVKTIENGKPTFEKTKVKPKNIQQTSSIIEVQWGKLAFEVDITSVKAVYLTKTKLSWIIDNFETRLKGFFFKEFNKANLIFQNRPI